jgi:hypothetical protein
MQKTHNITLLTSNHKLDKRVGKWTFIGLQLSPANSSGFNVCPRASVANSPENLNHVLDAATRGFKVAVPFKKDLPKLWLGHKVTNADVHDGFFLRRNPVQGLAFKGFKDPSLGCTTYCVAHTAMGQFPVVKSARIRRTEFLFNDRPGFISQLADEIALHQRKAWKNGLRLAVRLNVLSDIPWEALSFGSIPDLFPEIMFYDYTKLEKRHTRFMQGEFPANYTLAFSFNKVWGAHPHHSSIDGYSEFMRMKYGQGKLQSVHNDVRSDNLVTS